MSDSTVLLSMIRSISKHYDIPYDDVLKVCNLGDMEDVKKTKKKISLEYIVIDHDEYLYDHKNNRVYTNAKKPECIGQLCLTTGKLITHT